MSACAAFCFACCYAANLNQTHLDSLDGQFILNSSINPNTAPIESLIRLPNIGIARAEALIEYRQSYSENSSRVAFETPDDLQNIKGIGPKTAQNISQWLEFE